MRTLVLAAFLLGTSSSLQLAPRTTGCAASRPSRRLPALQFGLLNEMFKKSFGPPVVMGEEEIMRPKAHGTSETPVQEGLRWSCDRDTADRICNFNRHYAEYSGYWESTDFLKQEPADSGDAQGAITFFDSNSGKPLFKAPIGRSWEQFVAESKSHGWPSFRDEEVDWENVRILSDGEAVSVDGTHLGHNLPDRSGNRYCINLVSIAGSPV
uniref:Peptide-methionine (R)-S-oxide reductase n=1 Tax=Rhizochromulina marina TaxID=1034831 RepID=A0A7S2SV92_9STRA|mmetsp:Transcript_8186/g.23287  ORF Transcript_8186/g.23287 Transcript_8186/m.23287 type:complete len:211 (+) Transcript_8186:52-684(+)